MCSPTDGCRHCTEKRKLEGYCNDVHCLVGAPEMRDVIHTVVTDEQQRPRFHRLHAHRQAGLF